MRACTIPSGLRGAIIPLCLNYFDFAVGVCTMCDAIEQPFKLGVPPSSEYTGVTPVKECEAIPRAVHKVAVAAR